LLTATNSDSPGPHRMSWWGPRGLGSSVRRAERSAAQPGWRWGLRAVPGGRCARRALPHLSRSSRCLTCIRRSSPCPGSWSRSPRCSARCGPAGRAPPPRWERWSTGCRSPASQASLAATNINQLAVRAHATGTTPPELGPGGGHSHPGPVRPGRAGPHAAAPPSLTMRRAALGRFGTSRGRRRTPWGRLETS
jgi:hypothetical protein